MHYNRKNLNFDSASGFEPVGREFESLRARITSTTYTRVFFLLCPAAKYPRAAGLQSLVLSTLSRGPDIRLLTGPVGT